MTSHVQKIKSTLQNGRIFIAQNPQYSDISWILRYSDKCQLCTISTLMPVH